MKIGIRGELCTTPTRNMKGKTTRVNVYWNRTSLRGARISNKPSKVRLCVRIR